MTKPIIQPFINTRYALGIIFLLLVALICAFGFAGKEDFNLAKQQVLLRKIGHEVLLQAGDSTSRVLPVREINAYEYQIRFENELTFQTDSLVKIISRSLEKNSLSDNYIVSVLNCSGKEVLFGYAILQNEQNNIIGCSGRRQPRACYLIDIKFQNPGIIAGTKGYLIGGISVFAFIGLIVASPFMLRRNRKQDVEMAADARQIGNTWFDAGKRQITIAGITTELTPKENKLLGIFCGSPNQVIERSRLQKEIWEDEGVIVGRSLDVFISKLRKKLENDALIRLVNVHGKGYRLQVGMDSTS